MSQSNELSGPLSLEISVLCLELPAYIYLGQMSWFEGQLFGSIAPWSTPWSRAFQNCLDSDANG